MQEPTLKGVVESFKFYNIVKIHRCYLTIFTCTIKSFLNLVFSLSSFLFRQLLIVLTFSVKIKKLLNIY